MDIDCFGSGNKNQLQFTLTFTDTDQKSPNIVTKADLPLYQHCKQGRHKRRGADKMKA